jgi:OOP family OmpA-OmpF porin
VKSAAVVLIAAGLLVSTGCASKKYVAQETAPVIQRVNELDDLTAQTSNEIRDLDARTQQGLQSVEGKAEAADQKALSAGRRAEEAQTLASRTWERVQGVESRVASLDDYQPVAETAVQFGFDQDRLTAQSRQALDRFASHLPEARNYIVEVVGSTDSTGDVAYNYALSQRRAQAVIQYLVTRHNIPGHKIYVIGLGQDRPVASNRSSAGRAQNRRVDVRLMSSTAEEAVTARAQD